MVRLPCPLTPSRPLFSTLPATPHSQASTLGQGIPMYSYSPETGVVPANASAVLQFQQASANAMHHAAPQGATAAARAGGAPPGAAPAAAPVIGIPVGLWPPQATPGASWSARGGLAAPAGPSSAAAANRDPSLEELAQQARALHMRAALSARLAQPLPCQGVPVGGGGGPSGVVVTGVPAEGGPGLGAVPGAGAGEGEGERGLPLGATQGASRGPETSGGTATAPALQLGSGPGEVLLGAGAATGAPPPQQAEAGGGTSAPSPGPAGGGRDGSGGDGGGTGR